MHTDWNNGWAGDWLWMTIMMITFWAAVVWVVVTLVRRSNAPDAHTVGPTPTTPSTPMRQSPQEVLAERLARGEIEPDDYWHRLDALDHRPSEVPN